MKTIVTGEFAAEQPAARAVDKLLHACLRGEQIRAFFLEKVRARRMPARRIGFAGTVVSAGRQAAVELDIGPAVRGDGVEVSACLRDPLPFAWQDETASAARGQAGILVAVETTDRVSQALAVSVLREHGADVVESTSGPREMAQTDCKPVALASLLTKIPEEADSIPRTATRH